MVFKHFIPHQLYLELVVSEAYKQTPHSLIDVHVCECDLRWSEAT
jgi:hypothetical protein